MIVVWLLRKHVQIGYAMLAGSIILFLIASPTQAKASAALRATLLEINTWEVVLAIKLNVKGRRSIWSRTLTH